MSRAVQNQYLPNSVSPPGETLLEILQERGMSQAELAERTGRPRKTINEIINGKAAITSETALQLERVLGVPASFWNNREQQYRDSLARQQEQERLETQVLWLEEFPYKEMIKLGWIEKRPLKVEQLQVLLNFFSVVSPEQWQLHWNSKAVAFRQSVAFESDRGAMIAWLRQGELLAQELDCAAYNSQRFKQALQQIRNLTMEPCKIFMPEVVNLCRAAGVAVVLVPPLQGVRASGVTRWLTATKALIQLSLRYKREDHFWFTFFHEARHVLQEKKREIFIETENLQNYDPNDPIEQDANTFAANFLIPESALAQFLAECHPENAAIARFARDLGIAPGIVVGRLQDEGRLAHSSGNELRQKMDWNHLG